MGLFSELCPEQQPGQQCAQPSLAALGLVPGWAGLWQGAGWPGAGQKEELCYIPELLSVEVCITQGPRPGRVCHLPVLWVGEKERRDMP